MSMTKGTPASSQIIWLEQEIARLTDAVERLTRERDEARDYAIKKSDEAHTIELELHARAEAAEAKVERLQNKLLHWKYGVTEMTDFMLAKIMWDAYCAQAGGKTFDGKPLPSWDKLGEERQACWLAAANAARDALGDRIVLKDVE